MSPWKIVCMLLVLLVPGGSLVLLAMATAKAIIAGRDRLLRHAVPVAQPVAAAGGRG